VNVHAEPEPLREPLPGGRDGATVSVEPLLGGEIQGPPGWFEASGGPRMRRLAAAGVGVPRSRWWWVPCPAYLVRHPSAGAFLIDTGLHPSVAARPHENMGRAWARVARPRVEPGRDLPAQLRERGIHARNLSLVVLTHLHADHASGISGFPNATFVVTAAEWHAATTDPRPLLRGYRPSQFDYVFDYRSLSYDGAGITSYSSFGRTFDLFADGSVRLAFTPGHTAGHQSVVLKLRDRDFVVAGDAVYTWRQLEGGPPPPHPVDPHTWHRSLRELQLFHRSYPQAVIVPGHDPAHWRSLDDRYE
jgi:N-acyl homoserine lactone hydrolase